LKGKVENASTELDTLESGVQQSARRRAQKGAH